MTAGRVELVILVRGNVDGVSGETSSAPNETTRSGHQGNRLARDKLVGDWLAAVRVQSVLVDNVPGTAGGAIVILDTLKDGAELGLLSVEGVTPLVLFTANGGWATSSISLDNGVLVAVQVRIDTQAEDVLMVVRVDAGVHLSTVAVSILIGIHGVCVQDTGKLNIKLDGTVHVEDEVDAVLVVTGSEDLGDDELDTTSDNDGAITEVSVLEENASILLVDTDSVLGGVSRTVRLDEASVHVVDSTLAVTAEGQAVGQVTTTVLAQIEGMLALVRVLRAAVGNNHLSKRETVHDGANLALIIEAKVAEDETFSVVETNVHLPVLPVDVTALETEGDTLWLGNVDWLDGVTVATVLLNIGNVVVVRRSLAERPADLGDINVNELLLDGVVKRAEVKGVGVLAVINVRAIVHDSLLKTDVASETLVITNCPACK